MLTGIEAQWRRRLWTLGAMARSPLSPTPCARCSALRRGSRWLSLPSETTTAATPDGRTTVPADNMRTRAPKVQLVPRKSLRPPKNKELVRPLMRYPIPRVNERSRGAMHQSLKAQNIQEKYLGSKKKAIPSWSDTLRMLSRRTPKRATLWKRHALKIVIPEEAVALFTTNLDDNIWDIHERTTCEIELYKGMEGDGRSALLLSGDDIAVQEATNIIMGRWDSARIFRPNPSKPDAPLLRGDPEIAKELCITSKRTHQPHYLLNLRRSRYIWSHRFEDIPKPPRWDQYSFINYIRTLTLAKLPPDLAIKFYGTRQAADEAIMDLLLEAFKDKTAIQALTVAAFRMALECMEERGPSFRPHARRLFTQAQIRRLPIDTTVFNKFLFGSVRSCDLENFNQMLDFMHEYGCVPNYVTWRLFLQMVHDERAKRHIVLKMDKIGLLYNPHATSDVVREFAGFDTYRAIKKGEDIKSVCREMDKFYGPSWPSSTALNRMLNVCGSFGRFETCFELLDHFKQVYQITPDNRAFTTLLAAVERTNNFPVALQILRHIEGWPHLKKTFHVYREIYTVAWRWRLANVMAVVWTYACLEEATCFSMRFRVSWHLANPGYKMAPNFRTPVPTKLYRFFALPGYVADGLRVDMHNELETLPRQARNQGAVITRLYRSHLRGYVPTVPLSEMIDKAWAFDKQLLVQRKAVSGKPGSHVLSTQAELGGGDLYLDVPVRYASGTKEDTVVKVPITSAGTVHNFEEGGYSDLERFPQVTYEPWEAIIQDKKRKELEEEAWEPWKAKQEDGWVEEKDTEVEEREEFEEGGGSGKEGAWERSREAMEKTGARQVGGARQDDGAGDAAEKGSMWKRIRSEDKSSNSSVYNNL